MDETRARATRVRARELYFDNPSKPPLDRGGLGGREFCLNAYKQKSPKISLRTFCGMDETRTRDLLRDRQAF